MKPSTQLIDLLLKLKENHFCAGLKTGTEIEDMDDAEIIFMKEAAHAAGLKLAVKTGGPEARRDMRMCISNAVDTILAPMIETTYALENFIKSASEIQQSLRQKAELAINLESRTAVTNLDDMIRSSAFQQLSQVTIGRGDLSGSLHLNVNDSEVTRLTSTAIRKISSTGRKTSVGGGWSLNNIRTVSDFNSDYINTRHTVLANTEQMKKNAAFSLYKVLEFEKALYTELSDVFSERRDFYFARIEVLKKRMLHKPSENSEISA